ncbi:DBP7 (YKR024C) [Zygosaccharomyces parabailii]|uniref:ATP-dependent RNA helicase n=1 Tax=Zygosaccharomyces bailii (strain CLIB 213 / ATCC 58445 / CBS 680 / BCRC 21525 / NBRC 1098 / NCYC 1416 / NRRL Y-2227) TaxID=1333698 RepID=A0A8J2T919_ZYGB2|nr:DBP7 (YKR024C) [Zygosaccharomyces parabailii]CDF90426.1 ZYBA0S07-00716g1_1 [Zygosaccharomyces bailii CLIB 213]
MSDDDSMLLNFITNEDDANNTRKASTKIVGGRWKDRRKMKMMMEGSARKRRKIETVEKVPDSSEKNDPLEKSAATVEIKGDGKQNMNVNSQVVSSLFTSNREISTAVNTNERDDTVVQGPSNAPLAGDSFEALGIRESLLTHLRGKMRIQKPTSIQKLVLSHLLSQWQGMDKDLFINAQTGSGKTLAYLLPIFSRILSMQTRVDRKSGCFALIVAPTRELASQIYSVATMVANCCHYLVPCLLIGGERKKSEKARLRKGCNFIVGTPGRILDHLQNTKVIRDQFSHSLRYVVLDEGDKLMELGFEETISEILKIVHGFTPDYSTFPQLPTRIVHILCSATLKSGVKKLGNVALKDYKLLSNRELESSSSVAEVPDQLVQKIAIVPPKLRLVTLAGSLDAIARDFVHHDTTRRTMVFLSCSDTVEFHYQVFSSSNGYYRNLVGDTVRSLTKGSRILPSFTNDKEPNTIFYKLHGSLSQQMRTATLEHFSQDDESTKGKHKIMFCTDVASRGLDLPHVGTVIEMDPPFSTEDHLHRIGRTARAGQSGEALLFLLPGEEEGYLECIKHYHPKGWKLVKYEKDILKPAFQAVTVDKNDREEPSNKKDGLWDSNATTWHLNVERRVLEDQTLKILAIKAFTSHIRAYATHVATERSYFNVKCIHLGHLAKSFALRERPKSLAQQGTKQGGQDKKGGSKRTGKDKMLRMADLAVKQSVNEFNY